MPKLCGKGQRDLMKKGKPRTTALRRGKIVVLVSSFIQDKEGKVLFLKRSKNNQSNIGRWQLPEGKMEFGEKPTQTLSRELREETGCKLAEAKLFTVQTTQTIVKGTRYHVVRVIFKTGIRGKIKLSKDHCAYEWLAIEEALAKLKLIAGTNKILFAAQRDKF